MKRFPATTITSDIMKAPQNEVIMVIILPILE